MKIKNTNIRVIKKDKAKVKPNIIVTKGLSSEIELRRFCAKALRRAQENGRSSLGFKILYSAKEILPLEAKAKIMSQEVFKFLLENEGISVEEILFVLPDKQGFDIFDKMVNGYLGYIQKKLQSGPFITVDIIIETKEGIVLIERSNPPFGWAIPGGFVDYGESLEEAAAREAEEETGLKITDLRQFHTYSKPGRDPRFHTISTVFITKSKEKPKADTDAKDAKIFKFNELSKVNFAFDHKQIIEDYLTNTYFLL